MAEKLYVPPPTNPPPPGASTTKRAPTAAERIKEANVQGLEARAMAAGLGINGASADAGKGQGGSGLDPDKVGQILVGSANAYIKNYIDGLTTLMSKMMESQSAIGTGGKGGEKDKFFDYLIGEVKDMKARLETPGADPIEQLVAYQQRIMGLQEQMRNQFGVANVVPQTNTPNIEIMKLTLEIEDRKTERQRQHDEFEASENQKQRNWTTDRDDRLRRETKEDQKWDADLKLRLAQIGIDGENKKGVVESVQDVTGAFIASLRPGGGADAGAGAPAPGPGVAAPAPAAAKEPAVNFPVSMTCTYTDPDTNVPCGTNFPWPAGQLKTLCPKCGCEYTLKAAQ
jgi:hypothetical protein